MSDQKEIVEVAPMSIMKADRVQLGMIELAPEDVIARGASIAKALAKVIKDRQLYKEIRGKAHVRVEGWTTLGAIVGIMPREREVKLLTAEQSLNGDPGYEAYVELVRVSDGQVIGGASAVCTIGEKNWAGRDEYAVRSMAITRATGKAFRLSLSWIMQLAGFDPTPAEEMPEVIEHKAAASPKAASTPKTTGAEKSGETAVNIGPSESSMPTQATGKTRTKSVKVGEDAVTMFWQLVTKWQLDKEEAQEVLERHGGNFLHAYEALKASLERQ